TALRAQGLTEMPLRSHIASVTMPGCVDGWLALHSHHGRLPLREVLAPAVDYARDGFPASASLAGAVPVIASLPGAGDYTTRGAIRAGRIIRRPGVARTLEAIGTGGRASFYEGEFGEGMLAVAGAQFTHNDLRQSQASLVEPLAIDALDRRL